MNYDNQEEVIKRIKNYSQLVEETITLIPTLPYLEGGRLYNTSQPGDVSIEAPYNFAEYRKFRKALGRQWERLMAIFSENSGYLYVEFRHKETGIALTIAFYFPEKKLDGAACHLIQAGEITKPTYKVVCDE